MRFVGVGPTFAILLAASAASAQVVERGNFPAERMRLSLTRQGIIDAEWGAVLPHFNWDGGLWLSFAKDPLVLYRQSDGQRLGALVGDRLGGGIVGALGLFDVVQVGVEIPAILYQDRSMQSQAVTSAPDKLRAAGFGDIRIVPKGQFLRQRDQGIDAALSIALSIPSGGATAYLGDRGLTIQPELAVSRAWSQVRVAANLGATVRRSTSLVNQEVASEASYRVAIAYELRSQVGYPFEVDAAFSGATALTHPFSKSNATSNEARVQLAYELEPSGTQMFLGGGLGLSRGWGTPDWRIYLGSRFGHVAEPAAGVPEPPAPLPVEPPVPAPEPLAEPLPELPPEPPPEPASAPVTIDRDGDGTPDSVDKCPDEPGPAENLGCPVKPTAELVGDKIEILDAVHFATAKDVILAESFGVLNAVITILLANPNITKVRIEGHTDNQADVTYNIRLSQRRAQSVRRYLIEHGVAASRLTSHGYGPTRPIATNSTREGRARNRRVEFNIVQRGGHR